MAGRRNGASQRLSGLNEVGANALADASGLFD